MPVAVTASEAPAPAVDPAMGPLVAHLRRNTELSLILLGIVITGGAYTLAALGQTSSIPANIGPFLGIVLAAPALTIGVFSAAAVAALPAGLAVLKGFAAALIGRKSSAAALPKDLDPAA